MKSPLPANSERGALAFALSSSIIEAWGSQKTILIDLEQVVIKNEEKNDRQIQ